MGHGTVADEIKGANKGGASGQGAILSIEEAGVRFRSYVNGDERFMGPEDSMEVQAKLGSDIALVFDECTPFHVSRDYTARSTERTHRWLDRCLRWHAEHGPPGQLVYGIVQGGVYEDLRRASAAAVAASGVRRHRDRRLARAGQGADVRGRGLDDGRVARRPPPPPARRGRHRRPAARRRARDRHLRLRDADAVGPPRCRVVPDPERAGESTSRRPAGRRATSRSSRAARARPAPAASAAPTCATCSRRASCSPSAWSRCTTSRSSPASWPTCAGRSPRIAWPRSPPRSGGALRLRPRPLVEPAIVS